MINYKKIIIGEDLTLTEGEPDEEMED